ncbi:hypothetical protein ENHY17A_30188 [Moraxellaceae bacterium 17A]|nr:hypothetical protein ENHY17A_30188 [Moraxellaceae bacterium 17A]
MVKTPQGVYPNKINNLGDKNVPSTSTNTAKSAARRPYS